MDSVLLPESNWETLNNRCVLKKDFRLRGHLVNITEKPKESSPVFDKISYDGCVHSKVALEYKIEFQFLPGILSAQKVYESHEWRENKTSQENDARSEKITEIIKHHENGKKSINLDFAWKTAFEFEGNAGKKKSIAGKKRKHEGN